MSFDQARENYFSIKRNNLWLIPLVIALIPLFFINYDDTLDFGDDNFQYLHQAKHLFNAKDAGYLINPQDYGPQKKGIVFSILLRLNISEAIVGYKAITLLTFFVCAISVFLFYSKHGSWFIAGLLTICFAYHPFSVEFKNEILSEFLFTAILFLFLFAQQKNHHSFYLATLLLALLALTRDVGVYIFGFYLISLIARKDQGLRKRMTQATFSLLLFGTVYLSVNKYLYPIPSIGEYFYASAFANTDIFENIKVNLPIYLNEVLSYFEFECPQGFNDGLKVIILLLMILGLTDTLRKKDYLPCSIFLGYLTILLCYPNQAGARRFLLPMFPFMLLFLTAGIRWLFKQMNKPAQTNFAVGILFLVIISLELKTISLHKPDKVLAATDQSVVTDLKVIKALTGPDDVIGFEKPYLLNYYCERKSYALTEKSAKKIPKSVTHLLFLKGNKTVETTANFDSQPIQLFNFELVKLK